MMSMFVERTNRPRALRMPTFLAIIWNRGSTSPCGICGAEDVVKAFLRHTTTGELGLTSPDGRFTVIEVECLGACGFATPVMVNEEFIESVTPEKVPDLLAKLA